MSDKYNGKYPSAWSQRDIAMYETLGQEPTKTSNGLWVSDVEREAKPLAEWVMAELYALCNGELITSHVSGTTEFYAALRPKAFLEHKDALRWGEDELIDWLLYERTPQKSPGGYFIQDPERWVKDASTWNDSELADLGGLYFGEIERSQYYILDEACERFNLPMGITFEDYCTYIQTAVQPTCTSNGVLINDRRRASKAASDWSDDELMAWVLGELDSERLDDDLLKCAIEQFGGEWFWSRADLRVWVVEAELPIVELDYSTYTDLQLKSLVTEHLDGGAFEVLIQRHGEELDASWSETEVRLYLLEGVKPLIPEPEVADVVVEAEEPVREPEVEVIEPEPEVVPAKVVDEPTMELPPIEIIPEGSPLALAIGRETGADIIEDLERRKLLVASKWSADELVAWVRHIITGGSNTTEATLMAALRAHCGPVVNNWTDDAVKRYVRSNALPEGFSEGILVEDIVRDRQHPGDWSDRELKAYVSGKIQTTADHDQVIIAARVRLKIPDRLTQAEMAEYVTTGVLPNARVPSITNVNAVSDVQLKAWLNGQLAVDPSMEESLFSTVRARFGVDVRWTDAHIVSFYRHGTEPRQSSDGVLIDDRLRDLSNPNQWSWKELRGLALEELDAEFAISDPVVVDRIRRKIDVMYAISPAHWSDDEVIAYLKAGVPPKALENGVFINDPVRVKRYAIEWRDAELKAWLLGGIPATDMASDEDLWEEIYVRFKVPVFWYREDAKSYVLKGSSVPATPSGIFLRDRNRDNRKVAHWTRREVKAWCRGQILPGLNTSVEELTKRAALLFGVSALLDTDSVKKRISDITEESMTMTIAFVTNDLASYEQGRLEAGDVAAKVAPYQSLLDRCIGRVLRLEGEDFVQGWTELLNFFHKNSKSICSAKKLYTGVGQMAITPRGLRNFQNMTSVLSSTCNPIGRDKSVKMIDWQAALAEVANEKARQGILAYYGVH